MYPTGDLTELAQRKAILQARIAIRRWKCAQSATELARPLEYVDRGIAMWRRVAPFAKVLAVPAGLMLTRVLGRRKAPGRRRSGLIGTLFTVLPLVIRGAKLVQGLRSASVPGKGPATTSG